MTTYISCFLDSARGVYIPRDFAEMIDLSQWRGIDAEQIEILTQGPDHEFYWDVWTEVLDNAETRETGATIEQGESGDLFLIETDAAVADFNAAVADRVEYEESHVDAGDGYAHLPREGDGVDQEHRLAAFIAENEIETHGVEIDVIHDQILEDFVMVSRHGFAAPPRDVFSLDSYPVGEIEIQIDGTPFADVMPYIAGAVDSYVNDSFEYAYATSDVFWSAEIDADGVRAAIDARRA